MPHKSLYNLVLGIALLAIVGCNSATGDSEIDHASENSRAGTIAVIRTYSGDSPYRVVCTTGMVADLVKNIAGQHAAVTQLMGEGVDPHLYKTSPGDVSELSSADIVFYSGHHLEGKMSDVLVRMARRKPVFAVTEYIADKQLIEDGKTADPHMWFDVQLWNQAANVVRDSLKAFDPKHAAEYYANAAKYQHELTKLDDYARQQIATITKDRRVMVTAHDAFRYFGRAYELEVRGIQGINTEGEASVREINGLVEMLASRKIKAVFVESSVSERNVQALVEGCRARGHQINIGGELFSDAMGKEGTPEGTYVGMVKHNVDTIVQALK